MFDEGPAAQTDPSAPDPGMGTHEAASGPASGRTVTSTGASMGASPTGPSMGGCAESSPQPLALAVAMIASHTNVALTFALTFGIDLIAPPRQSIFRGILFHPSARPQFSQMRVALRAWARQGRAQFLSIR